MLSIKFGASIFPTILRIVPALRVAGQFWSPDRRGRLCATCIITRTIEIPSGHNHITVPSTGMNVAQKTSVRF